MSDQPLADTATHREDETPTGELEATAALNLKQRSLQNKLFDILHQVFLNLDREKRKRQPKSIQRKAVDILRVIPRWTKHAERLTADGTINLDREWDLCAKLHATVTEIVNALAGRVAVNVLEDEEAEKEYRNLKMSVVTFLDTLTAGMVAAEIAPPAKTHLADHPAHAVAGSQS